ncbi:hypothetical protein [Candidatus Galacturonibacter soehngenii]|uniref:Uncharacterized protein n=1 Tax=Candidatus Galacturonatibacter soehngenii TaxID=2307010 RepID=A0A7V7UCS1_9FIRM|nr:hypothetical protein [Candidatus Galacturonibacter soehngenii]KAB1439747.1 hypothetical protein F7O84_05000 [Candidatus Galacturonibacter soehngenii]
MHVKAKQVAFLGLLAAMVTLLIILSSLIESNTLFLLAAASFFVGIAIREFGLKIGFGFFIACILLGFLLSPNKLYVLTYTGFTLYILLNEALYLLLNKISREKQKVALFVLKFIFFNLLYIPVLFFFPQILFPNGISKNVFYMFLLAGQLGWFVYDRAYEYFQAMVWGKYRSRIGLLR